MKLNLFLLTFIIHFKKLNDVALATLDWVHWYNHKHLHSKNGYLSPIDVDNINYCSLKMLGYAARLKQSCLR